jgi:hypothetical protein
MAGLCGCRERLESDTQHANIINTKLQIVTCFKVGYFPSSDGSFEWKIGPTSTSHCVVEPFPQTNLIYFKH